MSTYSISAHFAQYAQNPHLYKAGFDFTIDTTGLNKLLKSKKYDVIIKNPDLFLTVFAKALARSANEVGHLPCLLFKITEQENTLHLTGMYRFAFTVMKIVEKIRTLFEATLSDGRVTVVPVPFERDKVYFMQPISLSVDLRDLDPSFYYLRASYDEYVKPSLRKLSEMLRGVYSEKNTYQVVQADAYEVQSFTIEWADEAYEPRLAPVKVPERMGLHMHYYQAYKEGKQPQCDLTLVSADGTEIKMHESVMRCFGGPALLKMLENEWKESNAKKFVFEETPTDVLQEFVEFLYLGEEALKPHEFLKKDIDVRGLLHLGVVYQIDALVKCCVNILYVGVNHENVKEIKALQELYALPELQALIQHLSLKNR
jgi:hypothetical protein